VEATDPPDDPTYPPDEETGESEEYILSADEVRDLANWVQGFGRRVALPAGP